MTPNALEHIPVFVSGTDGYCGYRIPAIETTPDGTLLAFAEARKHNLADPGGDGQTIDLVMKRSTDSGATWSEMVVIEAPGEYWSAANACTVTDRDTGKVWLVYLRCRPGATSRKARPGSDDVSVLARWSGDNGVTWSDPDDLTEASRDMADETWRCTVPGPGGAIQDRNGRLIIPCWRLEPWTNFALFSDDHGATWQRGEDVPGGIQGNENQVAELADGTVLMDIRQGEGDHRWFAESADGGMTWGAPRPGIEVSPVACAIKMLPAAKGERMPGLLLWTGPRGPGRRDLVARISTDSARTFGEPILICASMAAYSDLTILTDGTPAVLWEGGPSNPYETLLFTRLTL